jgi:hypothetical protein
MLRKLSIKIAMLAAFATLSIASTKAMALTKSACTVTRVLYDGNSNSRLAVWCSGDANIYYAFNNDPSCGTQVSVNTLKIWESIFQSALLSGRKVDFNFNNGPAACAIPLMSSNIQINAS